MTINFGIEYEIENAYGVGRPRGWDKDIDGTLRDDGYEFKFQNKADLSRSKLRVRRLLTELEGHDVRITHRCSTHIHVDVSGLQGLQLVTMYLALLAHDDWFFSFSPARKTNNFCAPVLRTPLAMVNLSRAYTYMNSGGNKKIEDIKESHSVLSTRDLKYCSINTMCLETLGTIELRHFDPIMSYYEMERILNRLAELYALASSFDPVEPSPADLETALLKHVDMSVINWIYQMLLTYDEIQNIQSEAVSRETAELRIPTPWSDGLAVNRQGMYEVRIGDPT